MKSRRGNYKGGQGAIKLTPEHADDLAGFFAFSRYKAALCRVPKKAIEKGESFFSFLAMGE